MRNLRGVLKNRLQFSQSWKRFNKEIKEKNSKI